MLTVALLAWAGAQLFRVRPAPLPQGYDAREWQLEKFDRHSTSWTNRERARLTWTKISATGASPLQKMK